MIFGGGWQGIETGTHNGKFSDWSYDFYIKSYARDFVTQLAKSVMETGKGKIEAIPARDAINVLTSVQTEMQRKLTDATQQRQAMQAELAARNADWTYPATSGFKAADLPADNSLPMTYVQVFGPTLDRSLGVSWYTANPYRFSSDGWLLQVGTPADLKKNVAPANNWHAGYPPASAMPKDMNSAAYSWPDPNAIFSRAETYSRLRAFEYALSLRLDAVNKVLAVLSADNLAAVKSMSEETVSTSYDFWTVTELPNAVQYVNPLLALDPLTLKTVVDVPFTPDPVEVKQAPDGSLTVHTDTKYDGLDALAAFRSGITPLQSIFVQPGNYLTAGQISQPAKAKSPVLALAAAGLALYFAVKQ